jgi:CheY-like chemotaxis protein
MAIRNSSRIIPGSDDASSGGVDKSARSFKSIHSVGNVPAIDNNLLIESNYYELAQARDVESGRPEFYINMNELKSNLRILVVDDSATSRKMVMKLILAESEIIPNAFVAEADDGDAAVAMVKESIEQNKPYDVVLMDSNMNKLDGPEAVLQLRRVLNFTGKVVGLTGNALPEEVVSFMSSGCDHVIVKPLKIQKLLDYLILSGLIQETRDFHLNFE